MQNSMVVRRIVFEIYCTLFELHLPKTKFFEKTQKVAKNGNFKKSLKIGLDILASKLHAEFYDRTINGFRDMMYLV